MAAQKKRIIKKSTSRQKGRGIDNWDKPSERLVGSAYRELGFNVRPTTQSRGSGDMLIGGRDNDPLRSPDISEIYVPESTKSPDQIKAKIIQKLEQVNRLQVDKKNPKTTPLRNVDLERILTIDGRKIGMTPVDVRKTIDELKTQGRLKGDVHLLFNGLKGEPQLKVFKRDGRTITRTPAHVKPVSLGQNARTSRTASTIPSVKKSQEIRLQPKVKLPNPELAKRPTNAQRISTKRPISQSIRTAPALRTRTPPNRTHVNAHERKITSITNSTPSQISLPKKTTTIANKTGTPSKQVEIIKTTTPEKKVGTSLSPKKVEAVKKTTALPASKLSDSTQNPPNGKPQNVTATPSKRAAALPRRTQTTATTQPTKKTTQSLPKKTTTKHTVKKRVLPARKEPIPINGNNARTAKRASLPKKTTTVNEPRKQQPIRQQSTTVAQNPTKRIGIQKIGPRSRTTVTKKRTNANRPISTTRKTVVNSASPNPQTTSKTMTRKTTPYLSKKATLPARSAPSRNVPATKVTQTPKKVVSLPPKQIVKPPTPPVRGR